MIFGSKLLSSCSVLAIYSFLKYICYRQTQKSSGNVENIHTIQVWTALAPVA